MTWRGIGWGLVVAIALAISWLWPRIERVPTDFEIAVHFLNQQEPDSALLFFRDPTWRGVASYRAGRFAQATQMFGTSETVLSLYNMGNSYAYLRDWPNAIATYQRVLRFDPDHVDARHNLALVQTVATEMGGRPVVPEDMPDEPLVESESLQMPIPQESNAQQSQAGESQKSDTSGNTSDTDESGEKDPNQRPKPVESTGEVGSAGAVGDSGDGNDHDTGKIVGTVDIERRKSTRPANILLGKIHDDPETVLRARMQSVYEARIEGLSR
jgi:hypothetical protein